MTRLGWKQIALAVILLTGAAAFGQVTTDNLVGAWNIAPADTTLAAPTLAWANLGNLYGGVAHGWDPAMGPVLQFDGTPGYLASPYADLFEPRTGTLEVWINAQDPQKEPSPDQTIDIADKGSGNRFVYGLAITKAGRAKAVIGTTDHKGNFAFHWVIGGNNQVTPNQWHQLVMRWNGNTLALFVDGQLVAVTSYTEVPGIGLNYAGNQQSFYIGLQGNWGSKLNPPYKGLIGATRLYSAALSETQILNNFLATKPQ